MRLRINFEWYHREVKERSLEMKKTMLVLGVMVCATLLVNPAMACDGKDSKQASNEGAACSKSAAKAAYA